MVIVELQNTAKKGGNYLVVFYKNIIKKIMSGTPFKYSAEKLIKLDEWAQNDRRKTAEARKISKTLLTTR